MKEFQRQFAAFFLGCVPARLFLVYLARNLNKRNLALMGKIAIIPVIGFMYYFLVWSSQKGLSMFEDIWWNYTRPFHAALYAAFAYFAIKGDRDTAWQILLYDVILGACAFIDNYSSQGA